MTATAANALASESAAAGDAETEALMAASDGDEVDDAGADVVGGVDGVDEAAESASAVLADVVVVAEEADEAEVAAAGGALCLIMFWSRLSAESKNLRLCATPW